MFLFISVISSMDQGIFPTAINIIKTNFQLTDIQFGLFASIFYFGKLIGSILFVFFINQINRKYLIIFSLIIISFCLYIITRFTQLWVLLLSRFIFGLFQVYFLTYMPLWCEQFTFQSTKITMITMIQLSVPFGIIIGCLGTVFIGWKYSIYLEIISNCLFSVFLLCFNEKYFSLNNFSSYDQKNTSIRSQTLVHSIFSTSHKSITRKSEGDNDDNNSRFSEAFKYSIKRKSLLFSLLARALLVLPLTVLHIWLNDYEINVLHIDRQQRLISFFLICTISPTIGTIIGGVCGKLLGNYERKCCLLLAFILFGISYISSLFIVIVSSAWLFTFVLSICICFSTSIIPILTGFIISSIPVNLKNLIGSNTIVLSILLGHLPGPYLYSYINCYGLNNHNPSLAMNSINYFLIIPLVILFIAVICKYIEKEKNNESDGSYMNMNIQSAEIKAKKSNLFTTSIAGIYGNHLEINEENLEDEAKDFISNSSKISEGSNCNNNMNSILSSSRSGSNPLQVSNVLLGLKDDPNKTYSSHYSADIKE